MDQTEEDKAREECVRYLEKRNFLEYDPFKYLEFNFMYSYIDEQIDIADRIAKKLNVKYLGYADSLKKYPFNGIVDEETSLCFVNFPCRVYDHNPKAKFVNIIFLIEPASVRSYLTDKAIKALLEDIDDYFSPAEDIGFYKEKSYINFGSKSNFEGSNFKNVNIMGTTMLKDLIVTIDYKDKTVLIEKRN